MKTTLRPSGIRAVGNVPWGTHFCQFYKTRKDLVDILVPYFKAGLEHNEFCMWITAASLTSREAEKALRKVVPDLAARRAKGQIEIISYADWYLKGGSFDSKRVLDGWAGKVESARARGYDGMRLTGNTIRLEKKDWASFADYEEEINRCIGRYPMIALCTYSLDTCGASEIIDVINIHQFALIKRAGKWEIVESRGHKESEADLRRTRDYLEKLITYANAPIICWDAQFRITRFNRAFEHLTDLRAGEVIGKDLSILFPKESRERSLSEIRRTLGGEQWEVVEIPILRRDGSIRIALWNSANVYKDDGKTLLATIAQGQDITGHKESEAELRRTRDYLEKLITYANAPIICWDAQFRITRFNRAFEHLTDLAARHVIGKNLRILFPKESREKSLREIRRTLGGEQWEVVEIPILRRDGGVRIVLWNSANVYGEDGTTLLATIAQGQDITARKQAEEVLKRDRESFERLVKERTKELLRAQAALERAKRLSDIGTLASTVAHELRNPLAAMSMAAANIRRKSDGTTLESHLRTIDKKVAESDQIISNLLFYSRIQPPRREPVDLCAILEECVDCMQARYRKKKPAILKKWDAGARVHVSADPLQMRELFNNILSNAYEAVPESGGRIEIRADAGDTHASVRVMDNGEGIAEDHLDRIFDPFYTTKAKGTGLGLAVCSQIVTLHGGTLGIEHTSPEGTTVLVSLSRAGNRHE